MHNKAEESLSLAFAAQTVLSSSPFLAFHNPQACHPLPGVCACPRLSGTLRCGCQGGARSPRCGHISREDRGLASIPNVNTTLSTEETRVRYL